MLRGLFRIVVLAGLSTVAFAQRPEDAKRSRMAELSNRAADLVDQKRYARAEQVLTEALAIDPNDLTSLYDLTCAIAGEGDARRALAVLRRANLAGFSDFARVNHEPLLAGLRDLAKYRSSFEPPDAAIRRAAAFHVKQLQSALGDDYTVVADEPNRLIYAVRERSAKLSDVQHLAVSLLSHECGLLFHHRPEQFVRVIVASQVDYSRLELRSEVQGSYDDATRTVLVKEAGAELRHELTHALHAADQHARGQQHPVWLVEGLGVAFEDGDAIADNWRLANVQAAARSNSLIPLDKLITQPRAAFNQRSDLAYGEAGSLIVYLHDKGLLERFYDTLVQSGARDPTARRALEVATAMSLAEIESDWRDWLTHRVSPPRIKH